MSRFHSSDQEIKETFLRNIDVELDDNQQMYLLFAITAIVEKPSLSIEELMDLSPLAVVFNQTGLANRYLRDLVHHVRRFSVAGPVTEIPDESNSAGVSSLTNPGFGSSADGQGGNKQQQRNSCGRSSSPGCPQQLVCGRRGRFCCPFSNHRLNSRDGRHVHK